MKPATLIPVIVLFVLMALVPEHGRSQGPTKVPVPAVPWAPRQYQCPRAHGVTVDGLLGETAWQQAAWTEDFVDIEGELKPQPRLRTRAKMLWDDSYFYVGAELAEPHLWATLRQRDTVIFHDNDFEVFIDPDGDTHLYYELEVNALGTVWDLLLVKPYRDGGPAVNAWDIRGLRVGVALFGTLNEPADIDSAWTVEMALPWEVLGECAAHKGPPLRHECWRVNFSRVEWRTQVVGGRYVKVRDPHSGRPLPEDNWVWSPQGVVNMHYPEMWGLVDFVEGQGSSIVPMPPHEGTKWLLRQLYYAQWRHYVEHGAFAQEPGSLPAYTAAPQGVRLFTGPHTLWATCPSSDGALWWIASDGRVWKE